MSKIKRFFIMQIIIGIVLVCEIVYAFTNPNAAKDIGFIIVFVVLCLANLVSVVLGFFMMMKDIAPPPPPEEDEDD